MVAAPAGAAAGTRGTVAIRPENITLVNPGDTVPGDANVASGTVTAVAYLGPYRHVRVRLGDGQELLLYQQANTSGSGHAGTEPMERARTRVIWWSAACTFYSEVPEDVRLS